MLDPNTDLEAGVQYTHHLTATSVGTWSPSGIVDALSGDGNFSGVSANLTHAGVFTSTVDVTFTYAGQGSNVGQNGQEMASVLNDHFSTTAFSWSGTDGGVTAAPQDNQSNTGIYIVIAVVAAILLFALHKTFQDAKEVL